eukprot:Tbor_TRINITY_DN6035_c0_g1::TRINITY_DN6035_c0_g1_i1::g.11550::m.11550
MKMMSVYPPSKAKLSSFVLLLGLTIISIFIPSGVYGNRPTCDICIKSGYPYLCKASLTSHICLTKAGDTDCDHEMCVCCKEEPMGGCHVCEETDEDDTEDSLEQADAWINHDVRVEKINKKRETIKLLNKKLGVDADDAEDEAVEETDEGGPEEDNSSVEEQNEENKNDQDGSDDM